ncbi:MAG: hypothetical protein WBC14_03330, partial [Propionicimonas sp.]
TLESAGFTTYSFYVDSERPKGTFLGTSPSGSAAPYSRIGLMLSKGPEQDNPSPSPSPTTKKGRGNR